MDSHNLLFILNAANVSEFRHISFTSPLFKRLHHASHLR